MFSAPSLSEDVWSYMPWRLEVVKGASADEEIAIASSKEVGYDHRIPESHPPKLRQDLKNNANPSQEKAGSRGRGWIILFHGSVEDRLHFEAQSQRIPIAQLDQP